MDLEIILAAKRQSLQQRKAKTPIDAVRALASMQKRPYPVLSTVGTHVTVIGQVKHTVSQTGSLLETYDPVSMALRYQRGGVDAISLYTDGTAYARGLDDLTLMSRAVNVPTIAQDYVLDEYHLVETRAAGASSVALAADVLDKNTLRTLVSAAQRNRMTTLIQVRNEEQLGYALSLSPHAIGLGGAEDCDLDVNMMRRMIEFIPRATRVLMMCCLESFRDIELAMNLNVDAIFVSAAFFSNENSIARLHRMVDRPTSEQPAVPTPSES